MRVIFFYFSVLFILGSVSQVNSQVPTPSKFNQPIIIFDFTYGLVAPMFDLGGSSIKEFYNFQSYGAGLGYGANFTTKVSAIIVQDWQFRPYLTFSYNRFLGSSGKAYNLKNYVPPGWPKIDTTSPYYTLKDTLGTSSISIHCPYISFGFEAALFTDKERTSYVNFGLDFDVSILFGKVYDRPLGKNETHNNIVSNTRLGLGMNFGVTYRVLNEIGLTAGTRLGFVNLFGKETKQSTVDGDIFLNDKSDLINSRLNQNRAIGYLGLYAGASFMLGVNK
jgi:hypothetical protein